MARKYAQIPTGLITSKRFSALPAEMQHIELLLLASPEVDPGGFLPMLVNRYRNRAAGTTTERFKATLSGLAEHGFIAIDYATEDIFLIDFYECEQVARQPRRVAAALDAIAEMKSPGLRSLAAETLADLVAMAPEVRESRLQSVVFARDGRACLRCGWRLGDPVPTVPNGRPLHRGIEIDHIHPKALGGSDDLWNLQTLCTSCNDSKGARVG